MVKRRPLDDVDCSVARTLDVVGDSWTLLIVRDALFDVTRFDDFQSRLGIPRTTLSSRLRTLVEHGVMEQRPVTGTGSRHEYVLTEKGRALHSVVVAMLTWGDRWSDLAEPPVTLLDATDGRELDPVFVDRATGIPLDEIRIERRHNTE